LGEQLSAARKREIQGEVERLARFTAAVCAAQRGA
jgi:hypothetical protein